jgi:hypothetical protein
MPEQNSLTYNNQYTKKALKQYTIMRYYLIQVSHTSLF